MRMTAIFAEKRHEQRAEYVKCGHRGREHANPIHPRRAYKRRRQYFILAEETGERWDARYRDAGAHERQEGNRGVLAKAAHVAQILLAAERVDHTACAKE